MRVSDFDFELPPERIALRPAEPRDSARMLVVRDGTLSDETVRDLPGHLRRGDVLVVNDTRVIPAQLTGRRGQAKVSVTLHKQAGDGRWRAFAQPAKKLRRDDKIVFGEDLTARVIEKGGEGEVTLAFDKAGGALFAAISALGVMPLPPYIARRRGIDAQDAADYQTMFAAEAGAVAAPTAGLHFTPQLTAAVADTGAAFAALTLHVGAGTFLPVKAEDTADHVMHAEFGIVTPETASMLNEARQRGGRVLAVGTTSLRLLETAADDAGTIHPFEGETDIFITPGYRFKAVDMLMTNFHLPRSTLFMLVAAFAGLDDMKAAYAHAVDAGYRFYSYGDANLLYRKGAA